MTELRTDRLLLRRARMDDLHAMHEVLRDGVAMRYWSEPAHPDLERTREWLASMCDSPAEVSEDFLIVRDGRVIGKIGAWRMPEMGFILRSDQWGLGLASEAMRAFLPHVFTRPDVDHLMTDVDPRNAASLKLLTHFGFVETGRATATWVTHLGVCDSVYLRLDRHDFITSSS